MIDPNILIATAIGYGTCTLLQLLERSLKVKAERLDRLDASLSSMQVGLAKAHSATADLAATLHKLGQAIDRYESDISALAVKANVKRAE